MPTSTGAGWQLPDGELPVVIHVALGVFAISATCLALSVVSLTIAGTPDVGTEFTIGSCLAVLMSAVLVWYVHRAGL